MLVAVPAGPVGQQRPELGAQRAVLEPGALQRGHRPRGERGVDERAQVVRGDGAQLRPDLAELVLHRGQQVVAQRLEAGGEGEPGRVQRRHRRRVAVVARLVPVAVELQVRQQGGQPVAVGHHAGERPRPQLHSRRAKRRQAPV